MMKRLICPYIGVKEKEGLGASFQLPSKLGPFAQSSAMGMGRTDGQDEWDLHLLVNVSPPMLLQK